MPGIACKHVWKVCNRYIVPTDEHAPFGGAHQIGYGLLVVAIDGLTVEAHCIDVGGQEKVPGREILRVTEQVRHYLTGARQFESP
ncbi:hypothetical protein D3C76_1502280 [compost metagenome]